MYSLWYLHLWSFFHDPFLEKKKKDLFYVEGCSIMLTPTKWMVLDCCGFGFCPVVLGRHHFHSVCVSVRWYWGSWRIEAFEPPLLCVDWESAKMQSHKSRPRRSNAVEWGPRWFIWVLLNIIDIIGYGTLALTEDSGSEDIETEKEIRKQSWKCNFSGPFLTLRSLVKYQNIPCTQDSRGILVFIDS